MPKRAPRNTGSNSGPFPFTYDEYAAWYEALTANLLEPARATFIRILNELLDQELSDVDRLRIRVSHSRIKSESRLWNKMLSERYASNIYSIEQIPATIDDLVGVRVTCNNLADVETFRQIVISLAPLDAEELAAGICIDTNSERHHSKESGYRAYHINLHTLVPCSNGWKPARGELQVRTLLQDSWGELTHEDTYKPGSNMPRLVTQFAKRMADLLATVDDLAQDLRNELDEMAQRDAGSSPQEHGLPDEGATVRESQDVPDNNVREALLSETRRVVESLTRPAPLAQVAWQIQADFGREVTQTWGGFGSFKSLLLAAAPSVQILDVPPGTIVPASFTRSVVADDAAATTDDEQALDGVPTVIHRLRSHDSTLPAVPAVRLSMLLDVISRVLDHIIWSELGIQPSMIGIREINQLTRYARSFDDGGESFPPRAHIDYILKTLYFSQNLRPGIGKQQLASIVSSYLFARASKLGLVIDSVSDRAEMDDWFTAAT